MERKEVVNKELIKWVEEKVGGEKRREVDKERWGGKEGKRGWRYIIEGQRWKERMEREVKTGKIEKLKGKGEMGEIRGWA